VNVREVELPGRRCLRVTAYLFEGRDGEPERRILLAAGWRDDPVLPVREGCISLPASALPQLIELLEELS
jgi:hypothetical protein